MSGSQIFLGDYLRAVEALGLGPDDKDERFAIAALLGLDIQDWSQEAPISEPAPVPVQRSRLPEPRLPIEPAPEVQDRTVMLEPRTAPSAKPRTGGLAWLDAVQALRRDPPPRATTVLEARQYPLLQPHWLRGIAIAALATRSLAGEIDLDALVEEFSAARPVDRLPLLALRTLSRGVQVLVDQGDGMLPFREDQHWLLHQLRSIIGPSRLEVLKFEACPSRGAGPGMIDEWAEYAPPQSSRAVLALTDLGIARPSFAIDPATEFEWLDFACKVRAASCPLVAFVPYPASRWPRRLARAMAIIEWDRATTAGRAARARRSRVPRSVHVR
jgi:hypothetical protein